MVNDAPFSHDGSDGRAFLDAITIRARAAYFLAVAADVFGDAADSDTARTRAQQALSQGWNLIAGAVQVAADDLYALLEDEDGTGLMAFGYEARREPVRSAAWNALITAMMYVTWEAYRTEGARHLPQTIESVDATIIDHLHRFAERTGRFDRGFASRLRTYLQANHAASQDELGRSIARDEVMGLKASERSEPK
jgi:hypothetical protein